MHLKKRWIDRRVYEYFAVNVAPYIGWRDPILVYQMGKVGSSSIRNSLFRCRDPRTKLVLMSHEFFPIRDRDLTRIKIEPEYWDYVVEEFEQDKRAFESFPDQKRREWRRREKFYSERIYRVYVKPGHRLRVITLVREPIANNVSMFFELFDCYAGHPFGESTLSVDEMINLFLEKYVHGRPLIWLDAELKTTLGVDVFQHEFSPEKGFLQITEGNVELLVLKCELDDAAKASAIASFLGLDQFELVRSNVSSNRTHANAYAEFKQTIRVPDALLDQMYESKYAKFFYSDSERAKLRARWSGRNLRDG
ncbi:MAG: hypothetical protein KDB27_18535 [Planctomycetales bacterium]|nr:hypothetical protein [Planctomycetales bacterium]